jgi:hypothetical protein
LETYFRCLWSFQNLNSGVRCQWNSNILRMGGERGEREKLIRRRVAGTRMLNAAGAIASLEKRANCGEQNRWPKATRRVRAAASINPQTGIADGKGRGTGPTLSFAGYGLFIGWRAGMSTLLEGVNCGRCWVS